MFDEQILKPSNGGKPDSVVLLLHGYGDSGRGLIGLADAWRDGLPGTEFRAPNAPYQCEEYPHGYQWFSLRDRSHDVMYAGIRAAAKLIDEYIGEVVAERTLPPSKIALVGFSQGTMISLYVAPRRAESLAGVVGYSGSLLGADDLMEQKKSAPPMLLVHGRRDEVVPFPSMIKAEECLRNAKIPVSTLVRPDLAHSIDDVGLAEGLKFLQASIAR